VAVEKNESGTMITGNDIGLFRIETMLLGLKLEIETEGRMRLTRGRSCYARIKSEFGFKGNKQKVYDQMQNYINERKIKQDHNVYGNIK